MVRRMGTGRAWRVAVVAAWVLAGCGGTGTTDVDPAVAPFVGDWAATKLVLTSVANPDVSPDLIELGAEFKLNVQPSGQYTAILIYAQQTSTEIGTLSVAGNTVTLSRDFPSPSTTTGVYTLSGNSLTLDGDTEFDFNLDGTPEPATVHFSLVKD